MLEILFSISFFFTGGNIIDTKINHHKYEKENFKEIFYLKTKESVNTYCIKHSELENVKKIKYSRPNGGQETNYKVTKPINNETKREYYSSGQLLSIIDYKDGVRNGSCKYFWDYGAWSIMSESNYKNGNGEVLHQGISKRYFERSFTIADDVKVIGAELKDGLLTVSLESLIPEEKKEKVIEIK
jgi:antitoxin component YwqK of YwqJK toxin-antitoxin module